MRIIITAVLLATVASIASARQVALPTHGGIPAHAAPGKPVPTTPNAPNQGVITRLDLAHKLVGISGSDLNITQQTVAILDRRPNGNGASKVSELRVGMQVRYRVQEGSPPQLAELWLLSDAAPVPTKSLQRK